MNPPPSRLCTVHGQSQHKSALTSGFTVLLDSEERGSKGSAAVGGSSRMDTLGLSPEVQ